MIPTGKGMFIWKPDRIGAPEAIAAQAAKHFDYVLIKIADGAYIYNVASLVGALRMAGVSVYGWQYLYLEQPEAEAIAAAKVCTTLRLDGFVIDAEWECKNKPNEAACYCHILLDNLPFDYTVGLSSYRFPSYHPEIPWKTFRAICDFDMPQVYWERAHNPSEQLVKSYREFSAMLPKLPYIPAGSAYKTTYKLPDGTTVTWKPAPFEITDFIGTAHGLECQGYTFWEWYCAQTDVPELWAAVIGETVPEPKPEPLPSIERVRVTNASGLNIRSTPAIATNIIGGAHYGSVWTVMSRVSSALGDWVQVGPSAYIAGWYTVRV